MALSRSLSARRAWIEILDNIEITQAKRVALRKESVDRNAVDSLGRADYCSVALRKESVDRNDVLLTYKEVLLWVALRKESVDRNAAWTGVLRDMHRRSPQGERG